MSEAGEESTPGRASPSAGMGADETTKGATAECPDEVLH